MNRFKLFEEFTNGELFEENKFEKAFYITSITLEKLWLMRVGNWADVPHWNFDHTRLIPQMFKFSAEIFKLKEFGDSRVPGTMRLQVTNDGKCLDFVSEMQRKRISKKLQDRIAKALEPLKAETRESLIEIVKSKDILDIYMEKDLSWQQFKEKYRGQISGGKFGL